MDRDFYVLGSFLVLLGAYWELFCLLSAPLSTHLGSQGALNSPKQLARHPHGEANGPMEPLAVDFELPSGPSHHQKP